MATINQKKVLYLENKARKIRVDIIKMIYQAQAGHPGGSLSAADIELIPIGKNEIDLYFQKAMPVPFGMLV